MTPGQAIKELRLKKGMTQEELASQTDIKTRTIQRIENDEVKPRAYTVQKISEALNIQFGELNNMAEVKENNNIAESTLQAYARGKSYGNVFLYIGILLLGVALGISNGIVMANVMELKGEKNEMIALGLIVWIGISCIACYFLSRRLRKQ